MRNSFPLDDHKLVPFRAVDPHSSRRPPILSPDLWNLAARRQYALAMIGGTSSDYWALGDYENLARATGQLELEAIRR